MLPELPARANRIVPHREDLMKQLRLAVVGIVVPALILVVFAVSAAMAGGPAGKTTVCHSAGHKFVEITINDHALGAHMRHGDVLPDEYGDCP